MFFTNSGSLLIYKIRLTELFYYSTFFLGAVTNKLNNNPPINPPYKVLFNGF